MEKSFLGSIGHLMEDSGLKEVLEIVYAANTVSHMLSGKAVSRAVCGHLMVDAALNTILAADVYNVPVPNKETVELQGKIMNAELEVTQDSDMTDEETDSETKEADCVRSDLEEASDEQAVSSSLSLDERCTADILKRIGIKLMEKKEMMTAPTARL